MNPAIGEAAAPALHGKGSRSGWSAAVGRAVLIIATMFGELGRQIPVMLAEPIRTSSLQRANSKLSLLLGNGSTFFSDLASRPIGWLADRCGPRTIFSNMCPRTPAALATTYEAP